MKLAVFFVLSVHGIGLLALLMQGCRRDESAQQQTEATNAVTQTFEATNPVIADTNSPLPGATSNLTTATLIETNTAVPSAVGTDYTVASGDNLWTIARKFHTTVKAITEANAGIDPAKLKPGQKLHIPPAVAMPTPATPTVTTTDTNSGEPTYVVKSGDTLSRIASEHHTTVRALRSANNLRTDAIKVGQKLKIPAGAAAPAGPTVATNPTTPGTAGTPQ